MIYNSIPNRLLIGMVIKNSCEKIPKNSFLKSTIDLTL